MGCQEVDRCFDLIHQVRCHSHREVVLHHDTEHRLFALLVGEERHGLLREGVVHGHVVATDVPMPLSDDVLEVNVIERQAQIWVNHRRDNWQAQLLLTHANRIEDCEDLLSIGFDALQPFPEVLRNGHLVADLLLEAFLPKPQQFVELDVDALGRSREVQGVGIRASSQVGHVDGNVFREALALAPDHPACAAARIPELVAAS
mmetsp:Transcript_133945/g.189352  ORF Transcript_133945/g.189352 Transcript_133945/m.189352 type:complete len:203 (-) Transcript_133945:907-1515(-)